MRIHDHEEIAREAVETEGAVGVGVRWLVTKEIGAPTFAMREFDLAPGGRTPHHAHPWEHEVYVLEGEGVAHAEAGETPIRRGMVVFVEPNEPHHFSNTGEGILRFLCLIPHRD